MDYGSRWYDPALGRFIQPDTIIPDLTNSQAWNRYSYVLNSPIMYVDPSGHWPDWFDDIVEIGSNIVEAAASVAAGVAYQMGDDLVDVSTAIYPQPNNPEYKNWKSISSAEDTYFQVGRLIGTAIDFVGGMTIATEGASLMVGGVGACVTGIGCPGGVALAAVGAVEVAAGIAVATSAVGNLAEIAWMLSDGGQGGGAGDLAYESIVDDLIEESTPFGKDPNNLDHSGNQSEAMDAFESITGSQPNMGDIGKDTVPLPGGGYITFRISKSTKTSTIQITGTRKWDNIKIKFSQ